MPSKEKNGQKKEKMTFKSPAIDFHMEADRVTTGISVSVSGVLSITDFNESFALLKLRRGNLKISGSGLAICVYENKIVEISGKVAIIEFI